MHVARGAYTKNTETGIIKPIGPADSAAPSLTTGCGHQTCYFLGPYDFAAIYNVSGLWNGSPAIDGTGQTIAIIGESDVDFKDIEGFQNMFGLPTKDPVLVLDGPDPGVVEGDETESDIDLSGPAPLPKAPPLTSSSPPPPTPRSALISPPSTPLTKTSRPSSAKAMASANWSRHHRKSILQRHVATGRRAGNHRAYRCRR